MLLLLLLVFLVAVVMVVVVVVVETDFASESHTPQSGEHRNTKLPTSLKKNIISRVARALLVPRRSIEES